MKKHFVNIFLLVLAGFAFIGTAWALAQRSRWWLFATWPVLYFLGYTVLGVSSYYWYYAPLVPGFIVFSALGVEACARSSDAPARGRKVSKRNALPGGQP